VLDHSFNSCGPKLAPLLPNVGSSSKEKRNLFTSAKCPLWMVVHFAPLLFPPLCLRTSEAPLSQGSEAHSAVEEKDSPCFKAPVSPYLKSGRSFSFSDLVAKTNRDRLECALDSERPCGLCEQSLNKRASVWGELLFSFRDWHLESASRMPRRCSASGQVGESRWHEVRADEEQQ